MSDAWEPVMPFVDVASRGGPYDDAAYAAGWRMGLLDARLSTPWLESYSETVAEWDLPQVDLIAMRHGFVACRRESEVDGWVFVDFTREGAGLDP